MELRLIGYTADLGHLVLVDEEGSHPRRYRLVIEPDLFATLDEVRRRRRDADLPVGDMVEFADRFGIDPAALRAAVGGPDAAVPGDQADDEVRDQADDEVRDQADDEVRDQTDDEVRDGEAEEGEGVGVRILDPDEATRRREAPRTAGETDEVPSLSEEEPLFGEQVWSAWSPPVPEPARNGEVGPEPEDGSVADAGALRVGAGHQTVDLPRAGSVAGGGEEDADEEDADQEARPPPDQVAGPDPAASPPVAAPISELSPAEIQSRLRAGYSVEEVAEEAGTEQSWIESWLVPIEAERSRILNEARAQHLDHTDLGLSDDPLGEAVDQNLAHVQVDPESIRWEVARPSKGTWRVLVRYVQGDRERQATWLYDPGEQSLTPASPEAREVGFTRRGENG